MIVLWPGGPFGIALAAVCILVLIHGGIVVSAHTLAVALLVGAVVWACANDR